MVLLGASLSVSVGTLAQTKGTKKDARWKSYTNARFAYAVRYPPALFPQGEADNGDGQIFLSRDGHAELLVYGSYDASGDTLDDRYAQEAHGRHARRSEASGHL